MQKNNYSSQRKSTKVTKILLVTIWLLIIALIVALGCIFLMKAKEIDDSSKKVDSDVGFNKNFLMVMTDSVNDEVKAQNMIFNINSRAGKISIVSLPYDLKVTVGEYSDSLENQYEYGGVLQIKKAVENLFDIKIDYYMQTDCDLLDTVSSVMGGVEYEILEDLYSKNESGRVICDIHKGKQTLSAQQFSEFFRYTGWDSITRCENLGDLAEKMINAYSTEELSLKIVDLFSQIATDVNTNLSPLQVNELQSLYGAFLNVKAAAEVVDLSISNGSISDDSIKDVKEQFKVSDGSEESKK